jgi:2,3-dihydroxybiphenyl 1,2-dioxygenase
MAKAHVTSLGYAIVDSADLKGWERFAAGLLGLQIAKQTDDSIEFRLDEKAYRLIVNRSAEREGIATLGWETAGPVQLAELADKVEAAGYVVTRHTREEARERRVSQLVSFEDPDGTVRLELFYGLLETVDAFVSPTGARFVTTGLGFGHAFQIVSDVDKYWQLYVDILGFTLSDNIEAGPDGTIDLNFFHCNRRHHSMAFAHIASAPPSIGHLMFEVSDLDAVGRAWDEVDERDAAPVLSTLGKHTNDKMVSFYVRSPSGFGIEYGTGGIEITDDWVPTRYPDAHYWGHHRITPVNPADPADHG